MTISSDPWLVVLLGPTGVGKTQLSLLLASHFKSPILSSDSRQIFKELKIGTAAPTPDELAAAPHHFIATHSIFDSYSAGQYEQDALQLLDTLFKDHPVVILSGGSMMYIDALCKGMDDIPTVDPVVRDHWMEVYLQKGLPFIQEELRRLDPKHYEEVDLLNHKRVLHALEICQMTGKPYSELRSGQTKVRPFKILKIGLNRPRPELYARINMRVDQMMAEGLLDEAALYFDHRQLNSLNTVGYKELYEYMEGKCTLDEAVEQIKTDSRRYAKRQLTWFRRDKDIHWFHPDESTEVLQFVEQQIKE